jgi:putative iron-only hydrogenase system regulator
MTVPLWIMGILVDDRDKVAPEIQEAITKYGSEILCRMGIPGPKKQKALITLVIESDLDQLTSFRRELDAIPGLSVQTLSFPQ